MRFLTLVRHAKSDWDDPDLDDHDRPLNERGKRVAPLMGRILASKYFGSDLHGIPLPDCILSSTALRAKSTASYIADSAKIQEDDIDLDPGLYDATADDILEIIKELPEEFEHAVVVGHNPGMQTCAEMLLGFGEQAEEIGHLVTCGTVILKLRDDFWALVGTGSAELVDYLSPKVLGIS